MTVGALEDEAGFGDEDVQSGVQPKARLHCRELHPVCDCNCCSETLTFYQTGAREFNYMPYVDLVDVGAHAAPSVQEDHVPTCLLN